jgi:hypothetical protein
MEDAKPSKLQQAFAISLSDIVRSAATAAAS